MSRWKRWNKARFFIVTSFHVGTAFSAEPLAPWNGTAPKVAVVKLVERVTTDDSPDFVPAAERIAVFDNDGMCPVYQPRHKRAP